MKKVKLLFLFLVIFLLTGCTIEYNLTFDSNLQLTENAIIQEGSSFFEQYIYYTPKEVMQNVITSNQERLDALEYDYEIVDDRTVTLNNHYDDYMTYISQNTIFQQFFEEINVSNDGDLIVIETNDFIPYTEGNPNYFQVEDININIKIPFKVLENNADKVDKKTGVYTWNINKETEYKKIILKFYKSKKQFLIGDYDFTVIFWIIIAAVFVVIIGFIVMCYIRYQKIEE